MVIGPSVESQDCRLLCSEASRVGVPSVVLDPYGYFPANPSELHINPLDGPEIFLDALASLLKRDHEPCVNAGG